tara:strand:+ start:194 stop:691 length:498 start_codon:yes stop_codon:yes gene_type:complete
LITEGAITLIDSLPYTCIKIEHGMAHLKRVGDEKRGRFKKMEAKMVPYLDKEKNLIVPKRPRFDRRKMTRFPYMKVIRDEVDLSLSHDLAYFVAEHLDTLVRQLALKAEINANQRGDKRITSAHWKWLELDVNDGHGFWAEQVEFGKDYKEYLRTNNKWERKEEE